MRSLWIFAALHKFAQAGLTDRSVHIRAGQLRPFRMMMRPRQVNEAFFKNVLAKNGSTNDNYTRIIIATMIPRIVMIIFTIGIIVGNYDDTTIRLSRVWNL